MFNTLFRTFQNVTYGVKKNLTLGLIIAALALGIKFLHIKVGLDIDRDGRPDIAINITQEDGANISIENEPHRYRR